MTDVWALTRFVEISDHENSLALLDRLLEKDPNNGYWNYLKAFCLFSLDRDLDVSLHHYNIAEMNGYDESWIRYRRGHLFMKLKKNDLARADLERAVMMNPDFKKIQKAFWKPKLAKS